MTAPAYKVDLRWPAQQRLTDRTQTPDAAAALSAYRRLLERADLIGQPCAARLVVDGRSLYYSDFTLPVGEGRIDALAPLRVDVDKAEADRLAAWRPGPAASQLSPKRQAIARWCAIEAAARDLVTAADNEVAAPSVRARARLAEQADALTVALNAPEPNTAWMREGAGG